MKTLYRVFLNAIPIIVMIGLIPFVDNDYLLTLVYLIIISVSFIFKKEKMEEYVFLAGFGLMIIFENLFISTGVEVFARKSLFGLMPLWLPFLWGYGFVAIKRTVVEFI